jgi:hypothetical protein
VTSAEHRIDVPIDMARDEREGMTSVRGMLLSLAVSLPAWALAIVLVIWLL